MFCGVCVCVFNLALKYCKNHWLDSPFHEEVCYMCSLFVTYYCFMIVFTVVLQDLSLFAVSHLWSTIDSVKKKKHLHSVLKGITGALQWGAFLSSRQDRRFLSKQTYLCIISLGLLLLFFFNLGWIKILDLNWNIFFFSLWLISCRTKCFFGANTH